MAKEIDLAAQHFFSAPRPVVKLPEAAAPVPEAQPEKATGMYPPVAPEAPPAYAHFTEPSHVPVGAAAFTLKVRGHAFQPGDEIVFERVSKVTTFVDPNTLTALISADDLPKEPTQLNVAVRRGKVDSRPTIFTVEAPQ